MKVGLYGGTFNPPHIGHLHVAQVAKEAANLDHVIFVPSGNSYMKSQKDMATPLERYAMTVSSVYKSPWAKVSTIETNRGGPSYMIDTVKEMKKLNPEHDFFLIVGQDAYEQIPEWHEAEELVSMIRIILVPRGKKKLMAVPPWLKKATAVICDPVSFVDVSSTAIRKMIKLHIPVEHLVNDDVIRYIEENRLYEG